MWGRPLDTCMMDVRFREKFQDALATVLSDQERAGLDILTHGDLHCDDDMAGRSWHHYPLQRWAGFAGDYLQSEATRSPWLRYPPGTLLNEIYTGWRWPRVVDKIEHRPLDYAKIWRMAQSKTARPVRFGTCCSQVMGLFLDLHTPKYKDKQEVIWDMAVAMNKELLALRDAGCKCIQIEEPTLHFWANTYGRDHDNVKFMIKAYNREVQGLDDVEIWIHTCWGNPNMQRVIDNDSYRESFELYLNECRGDVWTIETKDRNMREIELFAPFKGKLKKKICIGAVSHRTLQVERPEDVAATHPPGAETHRPGATDRVERLRLWPAGLQPGHRVLQDRRHRAGNEHRAAGAGPAGDARARGRPGATDRHRAQDGASLARGRRPSSGVAHAVERERDPGPWSIISKSATLSAARSRGPSRPGPLRGRVAVRARGQRDVAAVGEDTCRTSAARARRPARPRSAAMSSG